jgi:large subunit ribosomal protein L15
MRKCEKRRASRTYGRGKKAGRGAGKRGGRGNAGLHKHKYITTVKYDPKHFGRYGFKRPKLPYENKPKTINVSQLEQRLDNFLEKGFATKKGSKIIIDLGEAGYDKLLGSGKIKKSLDVKVDYASERAISKVKAAGGQVLSESEEDSEEIIQEAE